MPREGRGMPDDRHFIQYIEQHVADSLDAAVAFAEAWAIRSVHETGRGDARYPEAAWFARQILEELKSTRYYVAQCDAHKAAWYALRLGELITDARNRGHLNGPDEPAPQTMPWYPEVPPAPAPGP